MEPHVVRCARYARISFDKAGDEHGAANQLADQQRVADARDFVIVRTEVDNDISALNGKHRPGYEVSPQLRCGLPGTPWRAWWFSTKPQ